MSDSPLSFARRRSVPVGRSSPPRTCICPSAKAISCLNSADGSSSPAEKQHDQALQTCQAPHELRICGQNQGERGLDSTPASRASTASFPASPRSENSTLNRCGRGSCLSSSLLRNRSAIDSSAGICVRSMLPDVQRALRVAEAAAASGLLSCSGPRLCREAVNARARAHKPFGAPPQVV